MLYNTLHNHTLRLIAAVVGEYIAAAALNLLNPEAVFIGGGVGQSLDVLLPGIREVIAQEVVTPARSVPILYTKLGYNAAFLGAACLPVYERRKQHDF